MGRSAPALEWDPARTRVLIGRWSGRRSVWQKKGKRKARVSELVCFEDLLHRDFFENIDLLSAAGAVEVAVVQTRTQHPAASDPPLPHLPWAAQGGGPRQRKILIDR